MEINFRILEGPIVGIEYNPNKASNENFLLIYSSISSSRLASMIKLLNAFLSSSIFFPVTDEIYNKGKSEFNLTLVLVKSRISIFVITIIAGFWISNVLYFF